MNHWIFLQVRLGSTRLPGKALLELQGKTVIRHAMEGLERVPAQGRALLTDPASLEALKPQALACGWEIFAGDPVDVLGRFTAAARYYGADVLTRATGDNPLVSAPLAEAVFRSYVKNKAHYGAYTGMPLGTGVEILDVPSLFRAESSAPDDYEKEHVAPYLYRRPEIFRIHREEAPEEYRGDLRLTLDTREDYDFLSQIFRDLYRGRPLEIPEVLAWMKKRSS